MKVPKEKDIKTINIRISKEAKDKIDERFLSLSRALGKRINMSKFIRHILLRVKSLEDLYQLGYISYHDVFARHLFGSKKDKNNKSKKDEL